MQRGSIHSITSYILLAMLCGMAAGAYFGARVVPLGAVGTVYIQLIKAIAIPLVFVTIIDAIIATALSWKTARNWLVVIVINSICALAIGLTISNLFRAGEGFTSSGLLPRATGPSSTKSFSLHAFLDQLLPKSIVAPFAENNVLAVVVLALLIGGALRVYCREPDTALPLETAKQIAKALTGIVTRLVLWLVKLVPLAVFCVTAKTVGESGFEPFKGLALYVGAACIGLLLQLVLVYPWWITRVGKLSLKRFWAHAAKPLTYAFGVNSSLATVPLSLRALDDLGVSKSASRLATCIGTNFNNDGILLYESMAVLFVAQSFGIQLSLGEQIFAALMSLFAAIGVAGIPEAGVVSLSLVLSAVGLPLEIVPMLLTVDWIVARMRSVVNVMSDMTVSVAVSGLEGRGAATTQLEARA